VYGSIIAGVAKATLKAAYFLRGIRSTPTPTITLPAKGAALRSAYRSTVLAWAKT
jgi:hypothetical protein